MRDISVWVEKTRAGNFIVRSQDKNGKRMNHHCIGNDQCGIIDGEKKVGRALANALRKQVEAKFFMGELGEADLTQPLEPLGEAFIRECENRRLSPCTIVSYEKAMLLFFTESKATALLDLSTDRIKGWIGNLLKKYKASTVAARYRVLVIFIHWLLENNKISKSPLKRKMSPSQDRQEPKFYSREQYISLDTALKKVCPLTRLGCALMHDMGLRKVEVVGDDYGRKGVLWEDVNWRQNGTAELILRNEVVKGSKHGRVLELTPSVLALMGSRQGSGPIVPIERRQFDYRFSKARKLAGLQDLHRTIHGLRHTFGKDFLQNGNMDLSALQEALGHTDIKTTQIYSKHEKSHIATGILRAHQRRMQDEALLRNVPGKNIEGTDDMVFQEIGQQIETDSNKLKHANSNESNG